MDIRTAAAIIARRLRAIREAADAAADDIADMDIIAGAFEGDANEARWVIEQAADIAHRAIEQAADEALWAIEWAIEQAADRPTE